MVRKCIVCKCVYSPEKSISFHAFPTDDTLKNLWLQACNMKELHKHMRVCSRHFSISCFKTFSTEGHNTLHKGAIPTLFLGKKCKYLNRMRSVFSIRPSSDTLGFADGIPEVTPIERNADHDYTRHSEQTFMETGQCLIGSCDRLSHLPNAVTTDKSKAFVLTRTNSAGTDHDYTEKSSIPSLKREENQLMRNGSDLLDHLYEANKQPDGSQTVAARISILLDHDYAKKMDSTPIKCKTEPFQTSDSMISSSREHFYEEHMEIASFEEVDMSMGQDVKPDLPIVGYTSEVIDDKAREKIWHPAKVGDCTDEHLSTPKGAKKCFQLAIKKLSESEKKLESSRRKIRRLQTQVKVLEKFVDDLLSKQLISVERAHNSKMEISRNLKEW